MRKHFILSTRTIVSKRNVTQSFGNDNTIIVPMAVLDKIKIKYVDPPNPNTERGKIAQEVLDYIESFDLEQLQKGVKQANGSILRVTTNYSGVELPKEVKETELDRLDTRILQTCKGIREEVPEEEPVILVSKDGLLRLRAKMVGVKAQTFRDELLPEISEQYTGRMTIRVSDEVIEKFNKNGKLLLSEAFSDEQLQEVYENMFVQMNGMYREEIGRVEQGYIVPLVFGKTTPYGVIPKNNGQRFMIEALTMDEKRAPLVIIKGPAGTAKTFMSLAVGLQLVEEENKYPQKILISRSPTETGEKIGFLPGDEMEKIGPYLRGIMDNLQHLHSLDYDEINFPDIKNKKGSSKPKFSEKPQTEDGKSHWTFGSIKAEAIGFIRGRSICDTYIIIDEAQNLTANEIKTIITRVGTGTKLVIVGDPAQIDRPEVTERDNGLSYASERLKGQPTCWQITLTDDESVRSELAKIASTIL